MTDFLVKKACELLSAETGFVLATIISHSGSLPRVAGTKMIITGDGAITGTIGGGLLEARVMQTAVDMISRQGAATCMPFDMSFEDVASRDMICGGRAEVFLDPVRPDGETDDLFERWKGVLEKKEKGFFITVVFGGRSHVEHVAHAVMAGGRVLGVAGALSPELLKKIGRETGQAVSLRLLEIEDARVIIEPAARPRNAFLFGAGHVAKFTAHLCALTGFYVTVLDDRREFANADNFPDSHAVMVLPDFNNALAGLEVGPDDFMVILTRGHRYDKTVLAQALKTEAGYIGMIGSRKKRATIYNALLDEGYGREALDRVHSPIGLAIGARSPEEIAVSIVSEMIQERAGMQTDPDRGGVVPGS